ncbi:MAG: hypothetical protein KDA80_07645 [Planctomycetaceae bacterium]|nr:hypothetical protein [Planctomycetaceae bacterium]
MVEVFVDGEDREQAWVAQVVGEFVSRHQNINLKVHDLSGTEEQELTQRLRRIAKAFHVDSPRLPFFYSCNHVFDGVTNATVIQRRLEAIFRIDVYVRPGCSHCAAAKDFLATIRGRYPSFQIRYRDIVNDESARDRLNELIAHYQQPAASVPVFHLCNQLIVGFDNPFTTGQRLTDILTYWTFPPRNVGLSGPLPGRGLSSATKLEVAGQLGATPRFTTARLIAMGVSMAQAEADDLPLLPIPGESPPPPPSPTEDGFDEGVALPVSPLSSGHRESIDLPWWGRVSLSDWGMPLFTIFVGLVDGFNPCAMWVLLFLLAILVNLRDRLRILAVAGTFVFISGAAYFAFMAAWLNVFLFVGLFRPIQITLGLLAIAMGAIHVKDFFAFKQGISLSIPDSAKPGIYSRVHKIVTAESLWGALIGASVLAVFVNVIELLCTAGLPALYSQILTQQNYSAITNYLYLLLYIVAYMFDDSLMVALVVVTMGKHKMQERHGRWLKLVSGLAIITLGLVLLVRPEWLM